MVIAMLPFEVDPLTLSIIAFIGVAGGIGAVIMLLEGAGSSTVEDRLEVLAGKKSASGADRPHVTKDTLIKEGVDGLSGALGKFAERFGNLELLFIQADTSITLEKFLLLMGVCAAVGVGGAVVGGAPVPVYPLAGLLCSLLPFGWLLHRRSRRFKRFAKQLPDAMELIARALRSGHSLAAAMKVVVDELPDPVSKEFNIAYEEQNLGIPVEQALNNLYYRMPNMDYKFFAMAVAIQRQSGGDLAEILDKIGHIIRERFRIIGQVQALTGEGRISGIVLMALPILLFFAVWKLNPEYVMLLFTDELGRKMVAVAVVLQILGAFAIKKIIAIKV
jgi:tight adherence protein B